MKPIINLLSISAVLIVAGCSGFTTTQIDRSYEKGQLVREIITKNAAGTIIDGKSELTKFKAAQTDKSQTTTVGALSQEANGTNAVNDAAVFLGALIKSAK